MARLFLHVAGSTLLHYGFSVHLAPRTQHGIVPALAKWVKSKVAMTLIVHVGSNGP